MRHGEVYGDLFPAPPEGALSRGTPVRVTRELTEDEGDARPGVPYVVEYAAPATFDLSARYSLAAVPDDGMAYTAPLDAVRPDLRLVDHGPLH